MTILFQCQRLMPQPGDQLIAIFCSKNVVERVGGVWLAQSACYRQ
jgi:hypothetical protein